MKGGKPDLLACARSILNDWNNGKIPFYTLPPKENVTHFSSETVSEWGKAFDIEKLLSMEQTTVLNKLPDKNQNALQMQSTGFSTSTMNEDGEEMEEEDGEQNVDEEVEVDETAQDMEEVGEEVESEDGEEADDPIPVPIQPSRGKKDFVNLEDPDNPQLGKKKKLDAKKRKKEIKKQKKRSLQQVDEQEDYDYSTHFGKQEEDDDIDISDI